MTYSSTIPGPLSPSKRKTLYKGILALMSEKCRKEFDNMNRENFGGWNDHSFDVVYIIAKLKTFSAIKEIGDNYLTLMVVSQDSLWPIFLEDVCFIFQLSEVYKTNKDNKDKVKTESPNKAGFDMLRKYYPEEFPL